MQKLALTLLCIYCCGDIMIATDYINETTITFSKVFPKKSFDYIDESPDHHPSSAAALYKGNEWVWDIDFYELVQI